MITCILMDSIMELPCKRQKCSEHFMVICDIMIKPLLPTFVTSVLDLSRTYRIPSPRGCLEGAFWRRCDCAGRANRWYLPATRYVWELC
jgi:hypothetical protein